MGTEEPGSAQGGAGPWWEQGEEPDYRATLANERTFLAWTRTALALLAGSLVVVQLSDIASDLLRLVLTGYLIALGVGTVLLGYYRWRGVQGRMRRGLPLGRGAHQPVIVLAVLVLAVLISVIAAASR